MAVTGGDGLSRVLHNRHYDDYASLKQYFRHKNFEEVVISGTTTTDGAAAEINFCVGDTINYIAAEGTPYARCEADDANQHSKYVYVEYQDDTGAVQTAITIDLDAADSTTEKTGTVTDFYRLRQMICEVESASGGGKAVILTDANMGGADDIFGFINDGNTQFNLERFFTQPDTTHTSYLGRVEAWAATTAADATQDSYLLDIVLTPKPLLYSQIAGSAFPAETQTAADKTVHFEFNEHMVWEPCIELDGGTEVIFKVGDNNDPGIVRIEATLIEFVGANVR